MGLFILCDLCLGGKENRVKRNFPFLKSLHLVLENVANLLRLDIYQLIDALTQKSMVLRGEEILSPLSVEQVIMDMVVAFNYPKILHGQLGWSLSWFL